MGDKISSSSWGSHSEGSTECLQELCQLRVVCDPFSLLLLNQVTPAYLISSLSILCLRDTVTHSHEYELKGLKECFSFLLLVTIFAV